MSGVRRHSVPRSARLGTLAALAVAFAGCSDGGPKLYRVTGQVFYEDKPAEGATVVFHPVNAAGEALLPGGTVGKDGTFTLNTYPHGEGAPEGEYVVLVTWFDAAPTPKEGEEQSDTPPKSKLPVRYADVKQSGLKATVKPGENTIEPFRLSRKAR